MKTKQIFGLFGIFILIISLGIGAYFAYSKGFLFSKPDPTIQPIKIKITNVNHDRFSVSWITEELTNGSVIFGSSGKLDQLQIDDTDQLSGQQVARRIHHVTLTNLDPQTTYQFKIRSGEKNIIFDDNGKPFSVKTAEVLTSQPPADLINGTVTIDSKPATDSIVYITLPGASPLSTQVKKDGTWLINLSIARNTSLSDYSKYDVENTNYDLFIQGDIKTSKVLLTTASDSPVPDVVLGESYDFTKDLAQASPTPSPVPESSSSANLAGQFPLEPSKESTESAKTPEQNVVGADDIDITNPFEEYEELNVSKPEFQGFGPANRVLSLTISSPMTTTSIRTSVTIDSSGRWAYTPTTNLEDANDYVLGLSYTDSNNELQTRERRFSIAAGGAGGTTPAYTATGSGTLATTPTPRATLAPRRSMPSTESGTPQSGMELPTIMILLLGLGLSITGLGWKRSTSVS